MSSTNQNYYSVGKLYSDQIDYTAFLFTPSNGGGPGDYFTVRLFFRKVGTQIYLEGLTSITPTSPTATPNWSSFQTSDGVLPISYRPQVDQFLAVALNRPSNTTLGILRLTLSGQMFIYNSPSSTNFGPGINLNITSGLYSLV